VIRTLALAAAATLLPMPALPALAVAEASTTITVVREYGDGPVAVPKDVDRVRIRFHGRAGDRVTLPHATCGTSLRNVRGTSVTRERSRFWRLPDRAEYEFVYRPCQGRYRPGSVQLTKLHVGRFHIDGPPVRLVRRLGYLEALALRVPASGRVQVSTYNRLGGRWPDLVLPDGRRFQHANPHGTASDVALEAGLPPLWQDGHLTGLADDPLAAGDRVLFIAHGSMNVVASTALEHDVAIDGPATRVDNDDRPYRETQLSFDGTAGQWVYLEVDGQLLGGLDGSRYHLLINPAGRVLLRALSPGYPYWQLPETGRYRLMVETSLLPVNAQVRVRTVRQIGAMPTDGTPVTFMPATPGEWTMATFDPPPGIGLRLHVVGAETSAKWSAFAEPRRRFLCRSDGPLGCFGYEHVEVWPGRLDSFDGIYAREGNRGWTLALRMPPGGTGSVTLSLVPLVSARERR
jgi:hypothetical protein